MNQDFSAMDLSTLPITHEATILAKYLDDMGHMNVMWYTHLFDTAVYTLFEIIGLNLDYMKANDAGGFALETHVRYLSEVRVGHRVEVRTRLLGRSQKRFHLMNFMTNATKGDLAATFEVLGAHIDMSIRRMATFPPEIAERLDELLAEHQSLEWEAPVCGVMKP